jgi:hypothetical protein
VQEAFQAGRRFVEAEGRLLERRMAACLFDDGPADAVVRVLWGYRNADGGFGHGLEPDKRIPTSQPLDVEVAFDTMHTAGHPDPALVAGACDWLQGLGVGAAVPCVFPSVVEHPHSPHWGESQSSPPLNPTASLAGYLWAFGVDHPWRAAATAFCWARLERSIPIEAHTLTCALTFLAHVPDRERVEALVPAIVAALPELRPFHVEPATAGYGLTPLHLAPRPDSPWRPLFTDDVIDGHLDALAAAQQPDGGWPLSWATFGPAATSDWRGIETLRALRVLRAYGRIRTR